MEPRVSFITLGVGDLERSTRFYRDVLGLPQRKTAPTVACFEMGKTWLSLYPRRLLADDAGVPAEGAGFPGFSLAHNVKTIEEVDALIVHAAAGGGRVVKSGRRTDWGGYAIIFFLIRKTGTERPGETRPDFYASTWVATAMHWVLVLLFIVVSGTACGGQRKSLSVSQVIEISGNERLSWDQTAGSAHELANLSFMAFVDGGAPVDLRDHSCSSTPGPAGFVCSSRLPAMAQGTHTIEVAAYVSGNGQLVSPRSTPIQVRLGAAINRGPTSGVANASFDTLDGVQLRADVVASGFDELTDLVTLPDGRVFIAERAGRVRVFRDGALVPSAAVALTDATIGQAGGLLAIAADRDFETTRAVYVLYTTLTGLRLARLAEANDVLGSRAILMDGLPISVSQPRATLVMGSDRMLYLALDGAGNSSSSGDLGSLGGKVLRLNKDGTTPGDQAAGTPVFATGLSSPTGMDWSEVGATLWLVGTDDRGSDQLQAFSHSRETRRGAVAVRYALPPGFAASALATYSSNAIPAFLGNVFLADDTSRSILRAWVDPSGAIKETEWMFRGQFDSVRAMRLAPDGSLYVGTRDQLVRVSEVR